MIDYFCRHLHQSVLTNQVPKRDSSNTRANLQNATCWPLLKSAHWLIKSHAVKWENAAKCMAWKTETCGALNVNGKKPAHGSSINRRSFFSWEFYLFYFFFLCRAMDLLKSFLTFLLCWTKIFQKANHITQNKWILSEKMMMTSNLNKMKMRVQKMEFYFVFWADLNFFSLFIDFI